ncbi:DUF4838 domain-containing protein [Phycisphaerales bacterium AB-hyl4]|uniref:DUF4838 domain-containing protein n=1 Tax=Natronomicrosphaera hydrolytica TaxID=3242702 RepID=A0ABV4U3E0_9BACT
MSSHLKGNHTIDNYIAPIATACSMVAAPAPAMTWVDEGEARAVIITADEPYPVAEYAAQELAYHVKLATGVELPIVKESEADRARVSHIYVGQSDAARRHQIDHTALNTEQCVIRTLEGNLFIVGDDGPGHPLDFNNTHAGTLWGVYEVLERTLHVTWLWPGELGVNLPRTDRVTACEWDITLNPHFARRMIRTGLHWLNGNPVLWGELQVGQEAGMAYGSDEALGRYVWDQYIFLRRHRMGRSDDGRPFTEHSFPDWWETYGDAHPEWFQRLPDGEMARQWRTRFGSVYGAPASSWDGRRGPADPGAGSLVSLCVSNKALHREIVNRWMQQREESPGQQIPIQLGENDILALCTCDDCLALDGPQPTLEMYDAMPEYVRGMYTPFDAGRRYAIFWKSVYEMAREVDPDVVVTAFVYLNYFVAPDDVKLHPNIVLAFVPWGGWWFPRDPREQQWLREQWHRWSATGATLYYRPNYTYDGASMPHNYARQMADEMQFTYRNGSIGTDFDTLTGQWAAQGTTLYLLARLHTNPDTPVEQLLEEYYSAFGPAAMHVKAYFDYWEAHTTINRVLKPRAMSHHRANRLHTYLRAAHDLFPPESFGRGEQILAAAAEAVEDYPDQRVKARIHYLQQGLTHARKSAALAAMFDDDQATDAERREAMDNLMVFRRSIEHLHIANLTRSARSEIRSFADRFDFNVSQIPAGVDEP